MSSDVRVCHPACVNTSNRARPDPPPDLLTAAEAAALLRVSVRTIHRWTADGTLPTAVRFSSTIRYARADVLKLAP